MRNILIVEGNSREIIDRNQSEGIALASSCYQNSLALHAADAHYDVMMPFAPDLEKPLLDLKEYDGIVLTGSGVVFCVSDREAKPYMDALDIILAAGKPILGSCWGMQSIAVALGGTCGSNPKGIEAGIAKDIYLTKDGLADQILGNLQDGFSSPCIHRDHVIQLPVGAKHLAYNEVTENQAMSYNLDGIDFLGVQFHPELEIGYIDCLLERRKGSMAEGELIYHPGETNDQSIHDPLQRTEIIGTWIKHHS